MVEFQDTAKTTRTRISKIHRCMGFWIHYKTHDIEKAILSLLELRSIQIIECTSIKEKNGQLYQVH